MLIFFWFVEILGCARFFFTTIRGEGGNKMPEVIVKLANRKIINPKQRENLGRQLQMIVAGILSVEGTQAELHACEVEVDYIVASSAAWMNGLDIIIKIEANQYPERAGRAQEFSDAIKTLLSGNMYFPPISSDRWNVCVRLAE